LSILITLYASNMAKQVIAFSLVCLCVSVLSIYTITDKLQSSSNWCNLLGKYVMLPLEVIILYFIITHKCSTINHTVHKN